MNWTRCDGFMAAGNYELREQKLINKCSIIYIQCIFEYSPSSPTLGRRPALLNDPVPVHVLKRVIKQRWLEREIERVAFN